MITTEIINELKTYSQPEKVEFLKKYLDTKTGDSDIYLGITVPNVRKFAKKYSSISLKDSEKFLQNEYHEVRLLALLILVLKFKDSKKDEIAQKEIIDIYLRNTKYINNWDFVDASAYKILGTYLIDKKRTILYELAKSENVWERRMAIVATLIFIRKGEIDDTYMISKKLLKDSNSYIHKAVGWALREAGKKDSARLKLFLQENYNDLPRITLRYAIERFDTGTRIKYMKGAF